MWKIKGKFCLINLLGNLEKSQALLLLFKTSRWSREKSVQNYKFIRSSFKDYKLLKDFKITLHYYLDSPNFIYMEKIEMNMLHINTQAFEDAQNVILTVLIDDSPKQNCEPLQIDMLKRILDLSTQIKIYAHIIDFNEAQLNLIKHLNLQSKVKVQNIAIFLDDTTQRCKLKLVQTVNLLEIPTDMPLTIRSESLRHIKRLIIRVNNEDNKIQLQDSLTLYPSFKFEISFIDCQKDSIIKAVNYYQKILQQYSSKVILHIDCSKIGYDQLISVFDYLQNNFSNLLIEYNSVNLNKQGIMYELIDSQYAQFLTFLEEKKKKIGGRLIIQQMYLKNMQDKSITLPKINQQIGNLNIYYQKQNKIHMEYFPYEKIESASFDLIKCDSKQFSKQEYFTSPTHLNILQISEATDSDWFDVIPAFLSCFTRHERLKSLNIKLPLRDYSSLKQYQIGNIYEWVAEFPNLIKLKLPFRNVTMRENIDSLQYMMQKLQTKLEFLQLYELPAELEADYLPLIDTNLIIVSACIILKVLKVLKMFILNPLFQINVAKKAYQQRMNPLKILIKHVSFLHGCKRTLIRQEKTKIVENLLNIEEYKSRVINRLKQQSSKCY
ncbi:hypothetical protein FGO68_gene6214 [Halteria grandinella]|uniref:Uncharacterized protein n=1 Tax=Halteria grandinella TaxID=5974 RepID=A0A8J8P0J7_HALGN|nr:hypothetical protein FGO68_gene6214 [Halteria grandinella]